MLYKLKPIDLKCNHAQCLYKSGMSWVLRMPQYKMKNSLVYHFNVALHYYLLLMLCYSHVQMIGKSNFLLSLEGVEHRQRNASNDHHC